MTLKLKNASASQIKIDRTGQRYGRLLITRLHSIKPTQWNAICDCGVKTVVRGGHIANGHTTSCGCVASDVLIARNTTHGHASGKREREYRIWKGMKTRCLNVNHHSYPDYGGRGIKICSRWLNSYENFLSDMGRCNIPNGMIERKNNDGPYSSENCRWATAIEQANNRRGNHLIEYQGETLTIAQWSRKLGFDQQLIRDRLILGWNPALAFTTPANLKYRPRPSC